MTRTRPPKTRLSRTHKIEIGSTSSYVTIFRDNHGKACDCFIVTDRTGDHQGWANLCGTFIGMCLQAGVPASRIIEKLRGQRFPPGGGLGEPLSVADGIAKFWEGEEAK